MQQVPGLAQQCLEEVLDAAPDVQLISKAGVFSSLGWVCMATLTVQLVQQGCGAIRVWTWQTCMLKPVFKQQ